MKKLCFLFLIFSQVAFADPSGRSIYWQGNGGGGYPMGWNPGHPGGGPTTPGGYDPNYLMQQERQRQERIQRERVEREGCGDQSCTRCNPPPPAPPPPPIIVSYVDPEVRFQRRRGVSLAVMQERLDQALSELADNPCTGCHNPRCNEEFCAREGRPLIDEFPTCICNPEGLCSEERYSKNAVPVLSRFSEHPVIPFEPIQVDAIPDPETIDYRFRTENTPQGQELKRIYTDLYKINPPSGSRSIARILGLDAVKRADLNLRQDYINAYESLKMIATGLLEIAAGFNPVSSTGISAYETVIGKNFFTNRELTHFERSMAVVGLMTAGTGQVPERAIQGMSKIYSGARRLLNEARLNRSFRYANEIYRDAKWMVGQFGNGHTITKIETALEANARLIRLNPQTIAPYQAASHVVHFKTGNASEYVRVHLAHNQPGRWMAKRSELQGLTPQQIQAKLSLPELPTHYSIATIPAETHMSRGMTNGIPFAGNHVIEGQVQYRIESALSPSWFSEMEAIGERLVF